MRRDIVISKAKKIEELHEGALSDWIKWLNRLKALPEYFAVRKAQIFLATLIGLFLILWFIYFFLIRKPIIPQFVDGDRPALGNPNAEIMIHVYTDLQNPADA
ncbi:MAG: hypothetical protein HY602_02865, partial [Parcubacteria group bacterium]|nr:hypothetical protein [Parcubacteria group bacterium]